MVWYLLTDSKELIGLFAEAIPGWFPIQKK